MFRRFRAAEGGVYDVNGETRYTAFVLACILVFGLLGIPLPGFAAPVPALRAPSITVERLLETHGWGGPQRDARLDAVAGELAFRLAGPVDGPVPAAIDAHLAHILASHGVSDAQVYPFTVRYRASEGLASKLPGLLGRLDRRLPPTHFGVGSHGIGSTVTTTVLLVHRGVEFADPLPRAIGPGTILPLSGELRRGYFRPRVLVAPPGDAPVRERPAWAADRRVEVALYFDAGPGVYGIEVVADSQYGPVVLDNHRIYVGIDPPAHPTLALQPTAQATQDRAAALARAINGWRRARGRTALTIDPDLSAVAAHHADEVAARRSLLHGSPDTGTLITRLRARGVRFERVAENLAEAADPQTALRAFLDSPGHKRNLMLRDLSHMGVAVVGRFYVVAMAGGLQPRDLR